MKSSKFYTDAEVFLSKNVSLVVDDFLNGRLRGRWHPMGFAVFHLGNVSKLGKLRFHMWPKALRVQLDGQPKLHSHSWDMCSLVVAGVYQDGIYSVCDSSAGERDAQQGFEADYKTDEESEIFPVARWYKVVRTEHRTIRKGQFHHLDAGRIHATHINHNSFATTFAMTSEKIDENKMLLIGDGAVGQLKYDRPAVTQSQLQKMRRNLERELQENEIS